VFDDYQLARVRGLESMIEEGVRQGLMAPHNPRLVSEAILGAAHRLRNQQFLQTGMKIGDAFSEFYELILNGLLVRPSAPTHGQSRPRLNEYPVRPTQEGAESTLAAYCGGMLAAWMTQPHFSYSSCEAAALFRGSPQWGSALRHPGSCADQGFFCA
jgi:hypothetical protein